MRPEVGLAMQPIMLRSVVFPEPLGPFSAVIRRGSMDRRDSVDRHELIRLSRVEDFSNIHQLYHISLITESGSIVEALQEGMMVATV